MGYKHVRSSNSVCHDRKKFNRPIFKCEFCNKFGHLEPFCYAKLRGSKWNNFRPLKETNTPRPKKIIVQKVKTLYVL